MPANAHCGFAGATKGRGGTPARDSIGSAVLVGVYVLAVGTELGVQALLVERLMPRRADGLELFAPLRFQIGHVASHPCERGDLAGECAPRPRQLVHHREVVGAWHLEVLAGETRPPPRRHDVSALP